MAMRMEVDVAGRGHDDPPGLERPPFAPDHPYPRIVDRIAEHRTGELDLAGGEGTGAFHGPVIAGTKRRGNMLKRWPLNRWIAPLCRRWRTSTGACRPLHLPLGQRKI